MAQPNITHRSFAGTENESFREFERLLSSKIGMAAIANNQRANILQLQLKDAALRDSELRLASLKNNFKTPQLKQLHIIKLESIRFDAKTDFSDFLVTLQNGTENIP